MKKLYFNFLSHKFFTLPTRAFGKLSLNIVPQLFDIEDIKIGIVSFKKNGLGKAIFKRKY